MTKSLRLRQAADSDIAFVRELYFNAMRPYVEQLFGWDEAEQVARFERHFAISEASIVELDDRSGGCKRPTIPTRFFSSRFISALPISGRGSARK